MPLLHDSASQTLTGVSPGHEHEPLSDARFAAETDHMLAARVDPSETVVVSGFWRSGTTWLQESLAELLEAKTIFEPFHFSVPATKKLFKYYGLAKKSESFRELFIPYCAEQTLESQPLLHHYYERALRADLPGNAVRVLRKEVAECHRTRVVVKFTRGQFSLHAAQNTFGMPILHVSRDPRAIVASAKMTDWFWLFKHLSLKEQLLEIKDGRARFFRPWADVIAEYDHDEISRLAAYWALTEKFLCAVFAERQARIAFVRYEELTRRKAQLMAELLERLGVNKARSASLRISDHDSFSTSQQRQGASTDERIAGWKKALTRAEIAAIEAIVQRLGFTDRLGD